MHSVTVQEPSRSELVPAGVVGRGIGAVLDLVVLSTSFLVPMVASMLNERQGPDGYWSAPVPAWAVPLAWFLCGVYLTAMTRRGATLGMRAADLRVVEARSGGAVGWPRAAVRTLVILAVLWGMGALAQWVASAVPNVLLLYLIPLAYGLTMLVLPQRQLPHDLLAGTCVVRRPGRGITGLPAEGTPTVRPDGYPDVPAQELLDDLSQLRHRVRRDVHATSVLLSALGLLALGGAAVTWSWDTYITSAPMLYWTFAAPLGLLLVAAWFELLRRRVGIAPNRGWLAAVIIVALAASLVSLFLLGPVVTGLAFLGLAVHERSRPAAVGAVLFAVVAGLEQLHWISYSLFSNRFPDTPIGRVMEEHGSLVVHGVLGLALITAGLRALRAERAR